MNIIEKSKKNIEAFFKQIDWEKVILNITLTAIIPIILFTIPIVYSTTNQKDWGVGIVEKLQQGILFSTIISIASNIVLSYRVRFRGLFSKKNQDNLEQGIKLLPFYSNLLIIIFSFVLMLLSAFYYGQISGNSPLNNIGIILEIILFILIQLLYGYSEGSMREDDGSNIKELQQKADERRNKMEKNDFIVLEKDNEDFNLLRKRRGGE